MFQSYGASKVKLFEMVLKEGSVIFKTTLVHLLYLDRLGVLNIEKILLDCFKAKGKSQFEKVNVIITHLHILSTKLPENYHNDNLFLVCNDIIKFN